MAFFFRRPGHTLRLVHTSQRRRTSGARLGLDYDDEDEDDDDDDDDDDDQDMDHHRWINIDVQCGMMVSFPLPPPPQLQCPPIPPKRMSPNYCFPQASSMCIYVFMQSCTDIIAYTYVY